MESRARGHARRANKIAKTERQGNSAKHFDVPPSAASPAASGSLPVLLRAPPCVEPVQISPYVESTYDQFKCQRTACGARARSRDRALADVPLRDTGADSDRHVCEVPATVCDRRAVAAKVGPSQVLWNAQPAGVILRDGGGHRRGKSHQSRRPPRCIFHSQFVVLDTAAAVNTTSPFPLPLAAKRWPAEDGRSERSVEKHMEIIGVLGGVASGKSAVAKMFESLGAIRLDADQAGHAVLGGAGSGVDLDAIGGEPSIRDAQGRLDRQAIARIVFADTPEATKN